MTKNIQAASQVDVDLLEHLTQMVRINRVSKGFTVSEPIQGTYGYVWILTPKPNSGNYSKLAVKTEIPQSFDDQTQDKLEIFEREMNKSLSLPYCFFALTTHGFLDIGLPFTKDGKTIILPALKMEGMDGTLQEWVDGQTEVTIENKLIAIVQGLYGLRHMYRNGFEGHGDIKPSNFLYSDMRTKSSLIAESDLLAWPSNSCPYRVVVADYGWADAWVDLDAFTKVLRTYRAPERENDQFIPVKSDMFSMGILISELCQGDHPARNLKAATKSVGSWERCVKKQDWNLSNFPTENIRDIALSCLSFEPADRPEIDELIGVLTLELKNHFHVEHFQEMLDEYEQKFTGNKIESLPWSAPKTASISEKEKSRTLTDLKHEINEIKVVDLDSCDLWVDLALTVIDIIDAEEDLLVLGLRKAARNYLDDILGNITKQNLHESIPSRLIPFKSLREFHVFSGTVLKTTLVAGSTYEAEISRNKQNKLVLSALAFEIASEHSQTDFEKMSYYSKESIRHSPDIADLYYWYVRRKWKFFRFYNSRGAVSDKLRGSQDDQIHNLRLAIKCDPKWDEPKGLLRQIEKYGWDKMIDDK
ncbi:protein kinase [Gammaproteobacteria bacterium]|nr:protein kinase [Gammaproteobacteria bacterium]